MNQLRIELFRMQKHQCPSPIDGLGDRGGLLQVELAYPMDKMYQLIGDIGRRFGYAAGHNSTFEVQRGEGNMQVQATPFQGVG